MLSLLAAVSWSLPSSAVTLLDKDEWKVLMTGFMETDVIRDTTQSFTEVIGNRPVARGGSVTGDNGQLAYSGRNSRLAFTVLPPIEDTWKTKGYFEFDFLGYDPAVSATNSPTQSQADFYSNPAIRIRHSYVSADDSHWLWLVGQTWSVFGWEPTYVLSTVSVAPVAGSLYQRTAQALVVNTINIGETNKLQWAISLERPSQRDSGTPNVDAGVKYSYLGRKAGFASASGDINAEPLSVALSGTMRQFSIGSATGTGQNKVNTSAVAADVMIPVLSADGKDVSNSLTFSAEFAAGTGFGDTLPGWSGNLRQQPFTGTTGAPSNTNLDAGQGGFDAGGNFQLVNLQTINAQLQYHLPQSAFVTVGYGQVNAFNMTAMVTSINGVAYNQNQVTFANVVKDVTKQIRLAAEYDHVVTTYVDNVTPNDDRYQLSAYFRF
jgi:hypothetical protein